MDNEITEQPTHIKLPIDLANRVTDVLLTLPAGQVFDLLNEMKARAIVVTAEVHEAEKVES